MHSKINLNITIEKDLNKSKNNSSYQEKDSNKSNELITNDLSDESTKLKKNESMTTLNR